eukprot:TRINITY_DN10396_c0_g1_i1.p1 TRINITY_DN10396_c0_g1~~TRINITY_DN10396_c0_g1_i1.p1  ORF type:complete len:461 (-),score=85.44 TRINITY_DN10396_c0_g1_i1:409-1791(-)
MLPCIRLGYRLMLKHETSRQLSFNEKTTAESSRLAPAYATIPSNSGGSDPQGLAAVGTLPSDGESHSPAYTTIKDASHHSPAYRSRHRRTRSDNPSEIPISEQIPQSVSWDPFVRLLDDQETMSAFVFKNYFPGPFRALREFWGYNNSEFLLSMSSANYLTEWKNPGGKSGSTMLSSSDKKIVVKSMTVDESKLLREMMRNYYQHMIDYPNTLIIRFLGLFSFKFSQNARVHFVVMENVMLTDLPIHIKYDLKGSRVGRLTKTPEEARSNAILKDMNVKENFHFGPEGRQIFLTQISADTDFLLQYEIMDYSLLLGVHQIPIYENEEEEHDEDTSAVDPRLQGPNARDSPSAFRLSGLKGKSKGFVSYFRTCAGGYLGTISQVPSTEGETDPHQENQQKRIVAYRSVYFAGIIDILQQYNLKKQMEYSLKGLIYEKEDLSVQEPGLYRQRFVKFLADHID